MAAGWCSAVHTIAPPCSASAANGVAVEQEHEGGTGKRKLTVRPVPRNP